MKPSYSFTDETCIIPSQWHDVYQYDSLIEKWVVFDWCKDKNGHDLFAGVHWADTKEDAIQWNASPSNNNGVHQNENSARHTNNPRSVPS